MNDISSQKDGTLYIQSHPCIDTAFEEYFKNKNSSLKVQKKASQVPDTVLWSVCGPVEPANGEISGRTSLQLGRPDNYTRWFALVRLWSPWLAPRHGQKIFRPDGDAVLAAFLRHDGQHVVVLAMSGMNDMLTVLTSDENGNIIIGSRNDREEKGTCTVLVAVGATFELANAAVIYHARKLVTQYMNSKRELKPELSEIIEKTSEIDAKWYEEWYEGLTYCTWNGLGQKLSADRIYQALDVLKENKIKSIRDCAQICGYF